MNRREPGYYWVKFAGEWRPAQFRLGGYRPWWSIIDSENYYSDEDMDEIGPHITYP